MNVLSTYRRSIKMFYLERGIPIALVAARPRITLKSYHMLKVKMASFIREVEKQK